MLIVDFTADHIDEAVQTAKQNYDRECWDVPALPPVDQWPDLNPLVENNLGVAAIDNGILVDFLCGQGVWQNAWGIQGLRNVFSPMHANGAIAESRAKAIIRQ